MTSDVSQEAVVVLDRVSFRYPDTERWALRDVDLSLRAGEWVALVGRNGAGKSTLARHLNGLLKPSTGRVLVDGVDTRGASVAALAERVGFAFQNPDHQLFAPTVVEDVGFGPRNLGLPAEEVGRQVEAALGALGLEGVAGRHPLLLGYGYRRLVALAGVLALGGDVLVLDEPTSGLDGKARGRVLAAIRARRTAGVCVLTITHDLSLVAAEATRVVALRDGAVVADGPTRSVLTDESLVRAAGLTFPPVVRMARDLAAHGVRADALTVAELCASYEAVWRAGRAEPGGAR